ncbi:hypothetical protein [Brevundimonas sp. FT23028]|uniref:hypothetical protein n=1 Tax=Brevundimonas sp. FT23028 TaxID=3393748 RepID=UPI003B589F64
MSPTATKTAAADAVSYFLSWDGKTQIAAVMSEDLHKVIWGRMTYGNRPHDGAVLVEAEDARSWIAAQMQARTDEAKAQRARAFAVPTPEMKEAA